MTQPTIRRGANDLQPHYKQGIPFVYFLLLISPLPFASARPAWQFMWVIFIGLYSLFSVARWKSLHNIRLAKGFYFPLAATFFLSFWGYIQSEAAWTANAKITLNTALFFLAHLIWFLLVFKNFRQKQNIIKLTRFIGYTATLYSLYGLIVYFTGNDSILWYEKWTDTKYLSSTFVNRNSFAAYTGIGLQCMLAYIIWNFIEEAKTNSSFKKNFIDGLRQSPNRIIYAFLSVFILLTSLMLTGSRAGIITGLIGSFFLVFSFFCTQRQTDNPGKKGIGYALVLGISALFFIVFSLSGTMFSKRMEDISRNNVRNDIYPIALEILAKKPLIGTGIGTFPEVFAQHRTSKLDKHFIRGHSDVIEIVMTAGVIAGGAFILALLGTGVLLLCKSYNMIEYKIFLLLGSGISLQIGLHSLVDFPLQMPAISYTFTTVISACAFLISQTTDPDNACEKSSV